MIKLGGYELYACYLKKNDHILAYSLHFDLYSAYYHLNKIINFHSLNGKIIVSEQLDKEFQEYLFNKVVYDITPKFIFRLLDSKIYKFSEIYKEVLKIKKSETTYYSFISKRLKCSTFRVIQAIKHNPFIILIPCHRIIKKNGEIGEYTPLGKRFKKYLLNFEKYY